MGKAKASALLATARARAGMSQRDVAQRAGTAQSVVARVELGQTDPSFETLGRLLRAAGFELEASVVPVPALDRQVLDDVPRILGMSPEDRLREVGNLNRFVTSARRV